MKHHLWVLEVLVDIESYACANGLEGLAETIRVAGRSAGIVLGRDYEHMLREETKRRLLHDRPIEAEHSAESRASVSSSDLHSLQTVR